MKQRKIIRNFVVFAGTVSCLAGALAFASSSVRSSPVSVAERQANGMAGSDVTRTESDAGNLEASLTSLCQRHTFQKRHFWRQQPNERFDVQWRKFRAGFIDPSGRVIDNMNGGISHSEGQGYALILAVIADDRATFRLVDQWTRSHLLRDDGLHRWKWLNGIQDENPATDGDLLIAWGLHLAALRWKEPSLEARSAAIRRAILDQLTLTRPNGRFLAAGLHGFSVPDREMTDIINPSYWVWPAICSFANITAETSEWRALAESGKEVLRQSMVMDRLPSDWLILDEKGNIRPSDRHDDTLAYNAIRIPLYLAWAGADPRPILAKMAEHADGRNVSKGIPAVRDAMKDGQEKRAEADSQKPSPDDSLLTVLARQMLRDMNLTDASADGSYYGSVMSLIATASEAASLSANHSRPRNS